MPTGMSSEAKASRASSISPRVKSRPVSNSLPVARRKTESNGRIVSPTRNTKAAFWSLCAACCQNASTARRSNALRKRPMAFARQVIGPWTDLATHEHRIEVQDMQYAFIARSGPTDPALACLRRLATDDREHMRFAQRCALLAATGDPTLLAELGDLSMVIPPKPKVHPLRLSINAQREADGIDILRAAGNDQAALALARACAEQQYQARLLMKVAGVRSQQPRLPEAERVAAAVRLLEGDPWEWSAIQARLVALDAEEPHLTATMEKIAADDSPIAAFARWVIAVIGGASDPPPMQEAVFLGADRDDRFVDVFASLVAAPLRVAPRLAELSDPRVIRGWCMGPSPYSWLSATPSVDPVTELLNTVVRIRLARYAATGAAEAIALPALGP